MAAPNGARRTKSDHPRLPMTLDEIAADALACFQAGATDIHLHVRDAFGRHSLDPGLYNHTIAAIRDSAPSLGIQITTESAQKYSVPQQFHTLQNVDAQHASVSVREMTRDPEIAARLYAFAADASVRIQHILYDASDFATLKRLKAQGIIPPDPCPVLLVFGSYLPPKPASPESVLSAYRSIRAECPDWAACAFGPLEEHTLVAAAQLGADVRIGFENNIHRPDGCLAISTADNIALFRQALKKKTLSDQTEKAV